MTIPTTALTPNGTGPAPAPAEPWTGNANELRLYGPDHRKPVEMNSPETASREVLLRQQDTLNDQLGFGAVERTTFNRNHVALLRETGLDPVIVGEPLAEAHVGALVSAARGVEVDPAAVQALDAQLRQEMRGQYGPDRAERLFIETQKFLEAHPKLRAVVAMPGFATSFSGKKAIEALLEHVRKERHI
jgi:hypothetical protein